MVFSQGSFFGRRGIRVQLFSKSFDGSVLGRSTDQCNGLCMQGMRDRLECKDRLVGIEFGEVGSVFIIDCSYIVNELTFLWVVL